MRHFKVKISIGGIGVMVDTCDREFAAGLKEKYRNFLWTGVSADFLKVNVSHEFLSDVPVSVSVRLINGTFVITADDFKCRLDVKTNKAEVVIPANVGMFDSFLRIIYTVLLLPYRGFLIHSAGLEKAGKGYLFAGPSSSGKTTTARIAGGVRVLSDELVLVKKNKGVFYVFATPFAGEFRGTIEDFCAPLEKILFLNKNLPVSCVKRTKLDTMVKLLENIFFFDSMRESSQTLLTLCREICDKINGYDANILADKNTLEDILCS